MPHRPWPRRPSLSPSNESRGVIDSALPQFVTHSFTRLPWEVSTFHLALQIKSSYESLLIAVPPDHWPAPQPADPVGLAERLLTLARRINPRQIATSKRKPKPKTPKAYVDAKTARAHVATAHILAQANKTP